MLWRVRHGCHGGHTTYDNDDTDLHRGVGITLQRDQAPNFLTGAILNFEIMNLHT